MQTVIAETVRQARIYKRQMDKMGIKYDMYIEGSWHFVKGKEIIDIITYRYGKVTQVHNLSNYTERVNAYYDNHIRMMFPNKDDAQNPPRVFFLLD